MEIRNHSAGDRDRPRPVQNKDAARPKPTPRAAEARPEEPAAEPASRAKAGPSAPRPSAEPAPGASGPELLAIVSAQIRDVQESAISERIRESGHGDRLDLSEAALRSAGTSQARNERIQELRREYLAGRLVTHARLEQAARSLLSGE